MIGNDEVTRSLPRRGPRSLTTLQRNNPVSVQHELIFAGHNPHRTRNAEHRLKANALFACGAGRAELRAVSDVADGLDILG